MTHEESHATRSVTICICTFRRPQVAATLTSLNLVSVPEGVTVDVVVADNDTEPTAETTVRSVALECRFPVTYVHAPARNISLARNACMDRATGRYLAFIDDDEIVTAPWLQALLRHAETPGVAAVLGPVIAHYLDAAPGWMRDGDFHSTRPVFVNGEILTGYTCNVLIDHRSPAALGLRFDSAFGRSGGEDTDFFARLHKRGGRIAFAAEAVVEEDVPADRARARWLLKRRLRMGQTHGQLLRTGHGGGRRLLEMASAASKVVACCLLTARHSLDPVERRRNMLRGVLHVGTFAGLLGIRALTQYGVIAYQGNRDDDAA